MKYLYKEIFCFVTRLGLMIGCSSRFVEKEELSRR
jgi:hypothetical protein